MKNYKLYIGLNDKNTLKQIIDTEKAIAITQNKMKEYKQGFSLKTLQGGYLMEGGQFIFENSIELSIFEISKEKLFLFCDYFKRVFNQECILIIELQESGIFY